MLREKNFQTDLNNLIDIVHAYDLERMKIEEILTKKRSRTWELFSGYRKKVNWKKEERGRQRKLEQKNQNMKQMSSENALTPSASHNLLSAQDLHFQFTWKPVRIFACDISVFNYYKRRNTGFHYSKVATLDRCQLSIACKFSHFHGYNLSFFLEVKTFFVLSVLYMCCMILRGTNYTEEQNKTNIPA